MANHIHPQVMAGFITEAKGYLPIIIQNIENFYADGTARSALHEAHRCAHTIRGAASMVGLPELSQISAYLERTLAALGNGKVVLNGSIRHAVHQNIIIIDSYLDGLIEGGINGRQLLQDTLAVYKRLNEPEEKQPVPKVVPNEEAEATYGADMEVSEELLEVFRMEAEDHLRLINARLAELEKQPEERELLQEIRRSMHTLKGAGGLVGLQNVTQIAHRSEDMLEQLADGEREVTPVIIDLLYHTADAIEDMAAGKLTGEPANTVSGLLTKRYGMLLGDEMAEVEAEPKQPETAVFPEPASEAEQPETVRLFETGELHAPEAFLRSAEEETLAELVDEPEEIGQPMMEETAVVEPERLPEPEPEPLIELEVVELGPETTELADGAPVAEDEPLQTLMKPDLDFDAWLAKEPQPMAEQLEAEPEPPEVELATVSQQPEEAMFAEPTEEAVRVETDRLPPLYEVAPQEVLLSLTESPIEELPEELQELLEPKEMELPEVLDEPIEVEEQAEVAASQPAEPLSFDEATLDEVPEPELELESLLAQAAPAMTVELLNPNVEIEKRRQELANRFSQALAKQESDTKITPSYQTGEVVRVPIMRLDELTRLTSEFVVARTTLDQRVDGMNRLIDELQLSLTRIQRIANRLETQYEASALNNGFVPLGHESDQNSNGRRKETSLFASTNQQTYDFDALEFDRYTELHLMSREMAETSSDLRTVGGELDNLTADFRLLLQRQGRLSSELQEKLLRVRMVPLSTITSRLQRTVRTTARQRDKQVELIVEGEATELDKSMLEQMADPLLHLLRNAVDHGAEATAERVTKEKPARARILVQSFYEGNQVVIRVQDDGRGIDPQQIRERASEMGLATMEELEELEARELYDFLFMPGFSTAKEVTEVSGRGVGLDVVRENVSQLKGYITADSIAGEFTSFTIRLPMTLALTRAIFVDVNQEQYAVPLTAVSQISHVLPENFETFGDEPVVRVGDNVYPVRRLGDLLNLTNPSEDPGARIPIIIVNVREQQVALVVDRIMQGREIIVKSLGKHLRNVVGISGATLLGDGRIVLILNLPELLLQANRPEPVRRASQLRQPAVRQTIKVMVVDDSVSVRRVTSNLLQSVGWEVVTAKDGLDAIQQLQNDPQLPDVVLLDIEMPRMDGYEFTSTIRNQGAYKELPIVVISSRAGEKHQQRAFSLGVTDYLVKPYLREQLLGMVRQLAEGHDTRMMA